MTSANIESSQPIVLPCRTRVTFPFEGRSGAIVLNRSRLRSGNPQRKTAGQHLFSAAHCLKSNSVKCSMYFVCDTDLASHTRHPNVSNVHTPCHDLHEIVASHVRFSACVCIATPQINSLHLRFREILGRHTTQAIKLLGS